MRNLLISALLFVKLQLKFMRLLCAKALTQPFRIEVTYYYYSLLPSFRTNSLVERIEQSEKSVHIMG